MLTNRIQKSTQIINLGDLYASVGISVGRKSRFVIVVCFGGADQLSKQQHNSAHFVHRQRLQVSGLDRAALIDERQESKSGMHVIRALLRP